MATRVLQLFHNPQGQYVWYNHPEDTWSPAKVLEGGSEDISVEMVDGGLVRAQRHPVSRPAGR